MVAIALAHNVPMRTTYNGVQRHFLCDDALNARACKLVCMCRVWWWVCLPTQSTALQYNTMLRTKLQHNAQHHNTSILHYAQQYNTRSFLEAASVETHLVRSKQVHHSYTRYYVYLPGHDPRQLLSVFHSQQGRPIPVGWACSSLHTAMQISYPPPSRQPAAPSQHSSVPYSTQLQPS